MGLGSKGNWLRVWRAFKVVMLVCVMLLIAAAVIFPVVAGRYPELRQQPPPLDSAIPLAVLTSLDRSALNSDDPIWLTVVLKNTSASQIRIGMSAFEESDFWFEMTCPDGTKALPTDYGVRGLARPYEATRNFPVKIAPGEQRRYRFDLRTLFDLSAPGNYSVRVWRTVPGNWSKVRLPSLYDAEFSVRSRLISFEVLPTLRVVTSRPLLAGSESGGLEVHCALDRYAYSPTAAVWLSIEISNWTDRSVSLGSEDEEIKRLNIYVRRIGLPDEMDGIFVLNYPPNGSPIVVPLAAISDLSGAPKRDSMPLILAPGTDTCIKLCLSRYFDVTDEACYSVRVSTFVPVKGMTFLNRPFESNSVTFERDHYYMKFGKFDVVQGLA